jgi:hypothetical protein
MFRRYVSAVMALCISRYGLLITSVTLAAAADQSGGGELL